MNVKNVLKDKCSTRRPWNAVIHQGTNLNVNVSKSITSLPINVNIANQVMNKTQMESAIHQLNVVNILKPFSKLTENAKNALKNQYVNAMKSMMRPQIHASNARTVTFLETRWIEAFKTVNVSITLRNANGEVKFSWVKNTAMNACLAHQDIFSIHHLTNVYPRKLVDVTNNTTLTSTFAKTVQLDGYQVTLHTSRMVCANLFH